jgi:hypothetical protein
MVDMKWSAMLETAKLQVALCRCVGMGRVDLLPSFSYFDFGSHCKSAAQNGAAFNFEQRGSASELRVRLQIGVQQTQNFVKNTIGGCDSCIKWKYSCPLDAFGCL